jgi:ribose transport system substrate-binding protein
MSVSPETSTRRRKDIMVSSLNSKARRGVLAGTMAAIALVAAACGSSDGGSTTSSGPSAKIDLGEGKTISVQGPPHIAYFMAGSTVPYLQARQKGIEDAVKKIDGASVASFDPQYDPKKQISQIQNAIASKKYNAFIVDATDGDSLCKILTEDAPAANIAVVNVAGPICGQAAKPDPKDHWAAGTVAIIDNQSVDNFIEYLQYIIKENPGPQKVVVLGAPALHPRTGITKAALKAVTAEHPDFKVVGTAETDFSVLQGQQKAQALLAANKDATIIFSVFSDLSQGAVTAVKQAGLTGKVKIYDIGGSGPLIKLVKDGTVQATTAGFPVSAGAAAVGAIEKAFAGEEGPRVILNDGGPDPKNSPTGLVIVDKASAQTFKAEG